jgi:Uma2 family endonuclease
LNPDQSEPVLDITTDGEQRVFLGDIRWKTFKALLNDLGNPHGRLAYDRGLLEIMAPSSEHEFVKKLLGRIIEALTEELAIPVRSLSSTTLRRRDLKSGIESDECYYIAHDPLAGKRRQIDLRRDPPPDLAIEVDISRSSLVRMRIHAALGIPEVWRWHGEALEIWRLQPDGEYREESQSTLLPMLPISGLRRFLDQRNDRNETEIIRAFRRWVREGLPSTRGSDPG